MERFAWILVVVVVVLTTQKFTYAADDAAEDESVCPEGWDNSCSSTCVKLVQENKNFVGAQEACRAMGGNLVTLENRCKILSIKGYLALNDALKLSIWIGAKRNEYGAFEWQGPFKGPVAMTGDNSDWIAGEPNNKPNPEESGEECIEMANWKVGKWNDQHCNDEIAFLCEKLIY